MKIEVKQVATKNAIKNRRKYVVLEVSYYNLDKNREEGSKSLYSFSTDKAVWDILSNSKAGEVYHINAQKNDKGFWDWVEAVKMEEKEPQMQNKGIPVTTRPNYETAEERARRQIYIIRQSSIASAIEFYKDHGKRPEVQDVLKLAKVFEDFVMQEDNQDDSEDVFLSVLSKMSKEKGE